MGTSALLGAGAGALLAAMASSDSCRGNAQAACVSRSVGFGAAAGVSVGTLAGYIISFVRP